MGKKFQVLVALPGPGIPYVAPPPPPPGAGGGARVATVKMRNRLNQASSFIIRIKLGASSTLVR